MPGTTPPQNADVHVAAPAERPARFRLEGLRRWWSDGTLLSGMSTSVVTPPAAAARVAVLEAFPVGAARLVDVDVGVDQPRQYNVCADVCLRHSYWSVVVFADRDDAPGADVDRRRPHAVGEHDPLAANDQGHSGYTAVDVTVSAWPQ